MGLVPRLIFWEITQKCNLNCTYCRKDSFFAGLPLSESQKIIDSIARDYQPLLVFTGGEPLLHPHFFEIVKYSRSKGLKIALATNATLIDKYLAGKIKSLDFHRVAVSLDGASPQINDTLRGKGAFLKTMSGIQCLKSEGVELQINTTVTMANFKNIPSVYELCADLGVKALHIFAFVPVGCGKSIPKEERLSVLLYEEFLNQMVDLSLDSKIEIKITCAPHYNRILSERQGKRISLINKGCLAGSGICFICARGEVYPCGYLALSAGNVLRDGLRKIWEEAHLFKCLRNLHLKGRCGVCEYIQLCGGCRARAYEATGDYLAEEPECVYQPLSVKS